MLQRPRVPRPQAAWPADPRWWQGTRGSMGGAVPEGACQARHGAQAQKQLHEDLTADDRAMSDAETADRMLTCRQTFLHQWRLRSQESPRASRGRAMAHVPQQSPGTVEIDPDDSRDRAVARSAQAAHQDPICAAVCGHDHTS